MTCEDWPCCGHEAGCCPDFDSNGNQTNMRCTCGAIIEVNARYSICESCMQEDDEYYDDDDYDDSMDGDHESGFASAGWGTDEDYGGWGDDYDF